MGAPANSGPIYRGINCSLPEDFLRVRQNLTLLSVIFLTIFAVFM